MRQESVKPACCLMDGAVVAGVEGGEEDGVFAGWWIEKDPSFKKKRELCRNGR